MTPRRSASRQPDETARALARLYDIDLLADPGDLGLYLALADRAGSPILELAAGTGRLAVPLALAGHDVTAVDLDPAMLERALARAQAMSGGAAGDLDLVEADLLDLDLASAGTYRLAFIALNSLFLLASAADQRRAFATMARHLAPGGLATVDVWLPDAADLERFDGRLIFEYERLEPETGQLVTKVAAAQHDPATGIVDLTSIYEEGIQGGSTARWTRHDPLRLVGVDELRSMAEEQGFVVEQIAGDYDLTPIEPDSERAILIARRA